MDWIDLRSDTVTKPTEEMLDAMRNAVVDDDYYGDDPNVNLLEKKAASILGKEDSLFVPSGTFGNQLAILTHIDKSKKIVIQKSSHIFLHETGEASAVANVKLKLLNDCLGRINVEELESIFNKNNIHCQKVGLICMENAHSFGSVVPLKNIENVYCFAKSVGVPMHLDGARIFNASIALNINIEEIAKYFDSIMFCLSKGLCLPIGSILAGRKKFIKKARKYRKQMGGQMRQVGYLAAAGLISLDKMTLRLGEDHRMAKYLADHLEKIGVFNIIRNRLDINMVFCKVSDKLFNEKRFIKFLLKHKIKISPRGFGSLKGEFRFVTHYWITQKKIDYLIDIINNYF